MIMRRSKGNVDSWSAIPFEFSAIIPAVASCVNHRQIPLRVLSFWFLENGQGVC
jgi:hypothetical protein